MQYCLEIRSYELMPDSQGAVERLMSDTVVPMLRQWGHDVVFAGPSLHAPDTYVLMRAYANAADRQMKQDAFYGSEAWRTGPRESLLALIKTFTSAVTPITAHTLQAWRAELSSAQPQPCD